MQELFLGEVTLLREIRLIIGQSPRTRPDWSKKQAGSGVVEYFGAPYSAV
jgi:hypothetical protein